jgi:hypothetical protein
MGRPTNIYDEEPSVVSGDILFEVVTKKLQKISHSYRAIV